MILPTTMPSTAAERQKLISNLATALVRTLGTTAALALAAAIDERVAEREQKQ